MSDLSSEVTGFRAKYSLGKSLVRPLRPPRHDPLRGKEGLEHEKFFSNNTYM